MSAQPARGSSQAPDKTREMILDVATRRLLHYGYTKTTMAEIAQDAEMSAANLYRYFDNKLEIVVQCTNRTLDARLEGLRALLSDPSQDVREKLLRYALELIAFNHELATQESRVGELVDLITRERPEVVHAQNEHHYELLADILTAANRDGTLRIADVATCAQAIHTAFCLFDVPVFVGFYSRDEFEQRARRIIDLLLVGLAGGGVTSAGPRGADT